MEEDEIVNEMRDQEVIAVRPINRLDNGKKVRTASIVLTFGTSNLPKNVHVGYERYEVRAYIPNPLRCFKCQKYGHGTNFCRSTTQVCDMCAEDGHFDKDCSSSDQK